MDYGEKEVMAGVRNAPKPGSELQKYFVGHQNMTTDLRDTLREFHNVRESPKYYGRNEGNGPGSSTAFDQLC